MSEQDVVDRGDEFEPTPTHGVVAEEVPQKEMPPTDEPEAEVKPEQPRDDAGKFIPKTRFDDAVGKERSRAEAAERRLAEIEQQQASLNRSVDIDKAAGDVAELRKMERAALLDGNEEKAASLSAQADLLNRRIAIAEAGHMSSQDKAQALEDMRMELTIERMEEKYPVLNSESEAFDQDIVDDILDKQQGIMQRERLSPSKALAKAVESIMRRGATSTPEERAGLSAAQGGIDRKAAAVAKNVAAAKAQPGSLKNAGIDSDKAGNNAPTPDAADMTFEEFNALPESTRSKMRGDFV